MSDTQSADPASETTEVEMLRRDPPQKCHVVSERPAPHIIVTACGLRFENPATKPIHTSIINPEKPRHEQVITPPVPEARCGNCPWDTRLK